MLCGKVSKRRNCFLNISKFLRSLHLLQVSWNVFLHATASFCSGGKMKSVPEQYAQWSSPFCHNSVHVFFKFDSNDFQCLVSISPLNSREKTKINKLCGGLVLNKLMETISSFVFTRKCHLTGAEVSIPSH